MDEIITKINIIINGKEYTATLEDNETAQEFANMLPLTITMDELNGNEKYYYFENDITSNPSRLQKIHAGEIMLYGSNCLVLFYETFDTSYSYTKIGKIEDPSTLEKDLGKSNIEVSFIK